MTAEQENYREYRCPRAAGDATTWSVLEARARVHGRPCDDAAQNAVARDTRPEGWS